MDNLNWHKIKSGDKQAFRLLFDEYYASLCLYANSVISNLELSQDIVSDCFIRIWERRETINVNSSLKNYLLLAVRNSMYSYLRSPESRKIDLDSIITKLENTPVEEYDLEKEETIRKVFEVMQELPEQRKKILELAIVNGMTYSAIAEFLGISVNTVKTQMSRAYLFLRDRLKNDRLLLWFFFSRLK